MKFTTQVQNPSVFNGLLEVSRCEHQELTKSLYEATVLSVKRDKVSPRIAGLIGRSFKEPEVTDSISLIVGKKELLALANAAALKGSFEVDFPEDIEFLPEKSHWTDGLAESYAPDSPMVLQRSTEMDITEQLKLPLGKIVDVQEVTAKAPTGETVL